MRQKLLAIMGLVFAFCVQTTAFAQEKQQKKQPKKETLATMTPAQRINRQTIHIARELMLDDATTAKFSPLYQKYLTDLQACQSRCKEAFGPKGKEAKLNLTDEQI